MDLLFVANVPDLSLWGSLHSYRHADPRPHILEILECTIHSGLPTYLTIVQELARVIASTRLNEHYLSLWDKAARKLTKLSSNDLTVIASALARGICQAGSNWRG